MKFTEQQSPSKRLNFFECILVYERNLLRVTVGLSDRKADSTITSIVNLKKIEKYAKYVGLKL